MIPVSAEQQRLAEFMGSGAEVTADVSEGIAPAMDAALRASPGASLVRWVSGLMDDSEQIDPMEANRQFGLDGTEAAFAPDAKVTVDQAKAVAEDLKRTRYNDFIMETVNKDAPVIGRVTQFAAGIAASFADPVMLAMNVGASVAVGKAIGAAASSQMAMAGLTKHLPSAARSMNRLYNNAATKSAADIMIREGAENFIGSVAEESINVIGLGEERLARKVTMEESALNVVAGTFLGSAFSLAASQEGRKAVSRSFSKMWGDNAGAIIKADAEITTREIQAGLQPTGWAVRQAEKEFYDPKAWHPETYTFAPVKEGAPPKLYLPLKEDGSPHLVKSVGQSTVLTDSVNVAMNNGAKVVEVDAKNLKLLTDDQIVVDGKPTVLGIKYYQQARAAIMNGVGKAELAEAIRVMKYPGDPDAPRVANKNVERELALLLDGKTMDQVEEVSAKLRAMVNKADNHEDKVAAFMKELGFDGRTVIARRKDGTPVYNSVAVLPESAAKLKKVAETDVPKPTKEQIDARNAELAKDAKDYEASLRKQQQENLGKDGLDAPQVSKEYRPAKNNPFKDVLNLDPEKKNAALAELSKLEREIAEAGESVAPGKKKQAAIMKQLIESEDISNIRAEEFDSIQKFLLCSLGE